MKRLDLGQLASFVALVDAGSFGRAAATLGLAQPTISQHIKRLEQHLDTRLVERTAGRSVPTPAGEKLLPLARSLLSIDGRARDPSSFHARSLGACTNLGVYLLPDLVRAYSATSESSLSLSIADNPTIASRLAAAEIDVALMEWWDNRPAFHAELWLDAPVVAIAPLGHAWESLQAVPLAALVNERLIGGEPGTGTGRLLRECLGHDVALPRPAFELGSTEAVKRAVASGLGVSIVLELTVRREAQRREFVVRPLDPPLTKPLRLVRRADITASDPLVKFLRDAPRMISSVVLQS